MNYESMTREQLLAALISERTITSTLQRELTAAHEAMDICHNRIRELEICAGIKQGLNDES